MLSILLLVGCVTTEQEKSGEQADITAVIPATSPATISPTTTHTPTLLPTTKAQLTPSIPFPTLTATPIKKPTLFVPAEIGRLLPTSIQLLETLTIKTGNATNPTDLSLSFTADANAEPVIKIPIAFAVPFTDPRFGIDSALANNLLADGLQQSVNEDITPIYWHDMPRTHRALTVDSLHPSQPEYLLFQPIYLIGDSEKEAVANILQAYVSNNLVQLTAVGDIMLDRDLGYQISLGNVNFPFENMINVLGLADFTIANLESSIGDQTEPTAKSYAFQAPPKAAMSLANAGIDLVSLANNHSLDYGVAGLNQTMQLLDQANIIHLGAGKDKATAHAPRIVTIGNHEVAFLSFVNVRDEGGGFQTSDWAATNTAAGLAWGTLDSVTDAVNNIKSDVDHVILLLHSGDEGRESPSDVQTMLSHAAIDAGASLVIGHHTHVLQGIEFYKDGVIAYGLGNFAFDFDGAEETAVFNFWLDDDGVREIGYIPAKIDPETGQPRLATWEEWMQIRDRINLLTKLIEIEK